MIKAYYTTRKGGSGIRPIHTMSEATHILTGGYGVGGVRLEDSNGNEIGAREHRPDLNLPNNTKWWWYFDKEAFIPFKNAD